MSGVGLARGPVCRKLSAGKHFHFLGKVAKDSVSPRHCGLLPLSLMRSGRYIHRKAFFPLLPFLLLIATSMKIFAATFFLALGILSMSTAFAADPKDAYEAKTFTAADGFKLPYRIMAPAKIEPGKKYPLVIFLHGAGERGTDNAVQLVHGMSDFASAENREKYPAFVVAPQCPQELQWVAVPWAADSHKMPEKPTAALAATLDLVTSLEKELPVDSHRLYITGLSMGGYGTWDAIQRQPKRFAAAAPICGGGDPAYSKEIKDIPVWAFHGDKDDVVKAARSTQMIDALKAVGGKPKYTLYPGVGHNSWSATYANPEFYAWLFAQKKS